MFKHVAGKDEPLKVPATVYYSRLQPRSMHDCQLLTQKASHRLVDLSQVTSGPGNVMLHVIDDFKETSIFSISERYASMSLRALIVVTEQGLSRVSSRHLTCAFPIVLITASKHAIMKYICNEEITQVDLNVSKKTRRKYYVVHNILHDIIMYRFLEII